MEAIDLLKEAEAMIKELQDAYVSHDGATALRRKIRKFVAFRQSVQRTIKASRPTKRAADLPNCCPSCGWAGGQHSRYCSIHGTANR